MSVLRCTILIEGGIESIRVFMLMTGTIWCDGHPSFFAPTQNAFLLVGAARELEAPPLLCICMVWNLHDPEAICDTEGCQKEETDDGMGEKGSFVCALCRRGETGKERDERGGGRAYSRIDDHQPIVLLDLGSSLQDGLHRNHHRSRVVLWGHDWVVVGPDVDDDVFDALWQLNQRMILPTRRS